MPRSNAAPRATGTDTTHFSVIDRDGNRAAVTLSLNTPFGSGFMPPGTGVVLNNEMDDFVAKPGVANTYGLVGNQANAIAPGKRPLSSMCLRQASPSICSKLATLPPTPAPWPPRPRSL